MDHESYWRLLKLRDSTDAMPGLHTVRASSGLMGEGETDWIDAPVPLEERGVRLEWLLGFLKNVGDAWQETIRQHEYQARAAMYFDGVPEPDPLPFPRDLEPSVPWFLVAHVIKPLTRNLEGPLYALVPPDQRGRPDVFISHTWNNPLIGFAASDLWAIGNMSKHRVPSHVWLDVVCYNQHQEEVIAIAEEMKSVIRSIGKLMLPMVNTAPFSRLWCLWELLCAHVTEADILIEEPNTNVHDLGLVARAFRKDFVSVEQLKTTLPDDRRQILEAMVATFGSIEATNEYLRRLVSGQLSQDFHKPYWRRWSTSFMERVGQVIEQHPGELTKNQVAATAGGDTEETLTAIDCLEAEGYVTTTRGRYGHDVYESVKPYREKDDPESGRYVNPGDAFRSD